MNEAKDRKRRVVLSVMSPRSACTSSAPRPVVLSGGASFERPLSAFPSPAMTYRRVVVLFALGFAIAFAGCGSEGDSEAGSSFDRARTWIEQQSATIQNVGEMIDAYERNDMQRAAAEMDSLRGTINWDKLGGPEMRDRILTIGTEVYTALDRPEDAARLIESALPHLDGDLRTRWDDLRSRLEDGTLPGTLEPDPAGEPTPTE